MIIDAISGVGSGSGTQIVQKPTVVVGTYTYDGTAQGPTITGLDTQNTIVTNATATNAGTYTLTIALKNSAKMVWNDMTTADLTYEYTINKATVTLPQVTNKSKTYNGSQQSPTIASYDRTKLTVSGNTGTNAGNYTVVFSLLDSNNYQMSGTNNVAWSIAKANQTITLSSNSVTLNSDNPTATVTVSGAHGTIRATSSDTSIATATVSGRTITISNVNETTGSATITVSAAGTTNYNPATDDTISVAAAFAPDGSTVTPTDDVQIWLHCAGITDKSYTTISQVLADSSTLGTLISSQNAVNYMVRSTSWAANVCANSTAMSLIGLNNYCANKLLANSTWLNAIANSTYMESVLNVKVPTMTSDTTPSGEVSASSAWSGYDAYKAFDGVNNTSSTPDPNHCWASGSTGSEANGEWIQYTFTQATIVKKIDIRSFYSGSVRLQGYKVQASNDGSTWTDLATTEYPQSNDVPIQTVSFDNNTAYTRYRILIIDTTLVTGYSVFITYLQFYGREDV